MCWPASRNARSAGSRICFLGTGSLGEPDACIAVRRVEFLRGHTTVPAAAYCHFSPLSRPAPQRGAPYSRRRQLLGIPSPKTQESVILGLIYQPISFRARHAHARYCGTNVGVCESRLFNNGTDREWGTYRIPQTLLHTFEVTFPIPTCADVYVRRVSHAGFELFKRKYRHNPHNDTMGHDLPVSATLAPDVKSSLTPVKWLKAKRLSPDGYDTGIPIVT